MCLVWLTVALLPVCAQQQNIFDRLESHTPGEGEVTVTQDARLKSLVGQPHASAEGASGHRAAQKISGFRVQVYAGNNSQKARAEASRVAEQVKELFPDLQVYSQFVSPRWLCRVGNYRSIEEADVVMRRLKECGAFKEVSIVRSQIVL